MEMPGGDSAGSWAAALAAVGGFILTALVALSKGTYKIASMERAMDLKITDESRNAGESDAALRQKIVEVELYTRDNFVRRDEFRTAVEAINNSVIGIRIYIENRDKVIDERFDKLRTDVNFKLDKLLERKA